jgi:CRP/FNR family transcriptional regulator, dissimilatory nitrate respiration regulator
MRQNIQTPPPFDEIAPGDLRRFSLTEKQTLFLQGAEPSFLFMVIAGMVSLQRHTESGQTVTLYRARAGDLLGEASLFSQAYHCDCVAEQDSSLLGFAMPAVRAKLNTDAAFGAALARRFALQVQRYRRQLELRSIKSARERVLAGLSDGWLTGNILQFATDLGLSHEATYRALTTLVARGLAQKSGRGRYRATPRRPP